MKKLTTEEFIEKCIKVHGNKYDYSKVIYNGFGKNVIIICKNHKEYIEFQQDVGSHLNGNGCKKCMAEKTSLRCTKTIKQFIEEANIIHNNKYDYSDSIYITAKKLIVIKCKIHILDFKQTPDAHLNGQGCPKCSADYHAKLFKKNNVTFINQANKIHNYKYNYSKVEYINWKTKVIIICPIHKEFLQSPNRHLNKRGCPKCANNKLLTNDDIDNFLIKNNINIRRVDNYIKAIVEINWECLKCKTIFKESPNNIKMLKSKCPTCMRIKSHNEILLNNLLKKLNINFEPQYNVKLPNNKNNKYSKVDFYLSDYNIFIEINGKQHYSPVKFNINTTDKQAEENFKKQKVRDQNLRDYSINNNINLLEIDSKIYYGKKLSNYIEDYLIKLKLILLLRLLI